MTADTTPLDLDSLSLSYRASDLITTDARERAAKTWDVVVEHVDDLIARCQGEEAPRYGEIGRARATVISLRNAREARISAPRLFGKVSDEARDLGVVYDRLAWWWHEDLWRDETPGTALFIESFSIEAPYRHQDLEAAILLTIIDRLGVGCSFAALHPHPVDSYPFDGIRGDLTPQRRLKRSLREAGFRPFRNDVRVLDLDARTFDSAYRRLLKEAAS